MNRFASLVVGAGIGIFVVAACSSESLETPRRLPATGGGAGTAQSGRAGSSASDSGSGGSGSGGSPNAGVGGGSGDGGAVGARGGAGGRSGGGQSGSGIGGMPRGEPCDNPGERRVEEDCCFGDCFPATTCRCTTERYWSCSTEHPCYGGQGPGGHGGLGGEGGNR